MTLTESFMRAVPFIDFRRFFAFLVQSERGICVLGLAGAIKLQALFKLCGDRRFCCGLLRSGLADFLVEVAGCLVAVTDHPKVRLLGQAAVPRKGAARVEAAVCGHVGCIRKVSFNGGSLMAFCGR